MNAPTTRAKRALAAGGVGLFALGASLAVWSTQASAKRLAPMALAAIAASRPPANPLAQQADMPSPVIDDARIALGRKIFFDPKLSFPEGTSCATCHDPAQGYAGNNGSKIGVARGSAPDRFARRTTPSVLYLRFVRRFHLVWEEEAELPEAFGGFFWDGRADTIARLIQEPLLGRNEMGNRDIRQVAVKVAQSTYARELESEFDNVFDKPESVMEALGFCLEAFLTSVEMAPFSSKYDEYLRGHETLTPLEARGLALFDDRSKAACSSCHKFDSRSHMPERSMFTDYGYDTVAVPRNKSLPPNNDPRHFDLGVCERHDPKLHTEDDWFCGSFRTPSLRNVATRPSYMHNGAFSTLRDVVSFYATRATDPKRWYKSAAFDDLPAKYHRYVNDNVSPYNRAEGQDPVLNDQEVDAIVAFLGTLTDRDYPRAP